MQENDKKSNPNRNNGVGFLGLLLITLLVLKITGFISSWFWVFSPILIPVLLFCIIYIIYYFFSSFSEQNNKLK